MLLDQGLLVWKFQYSLRRLLGRHHALVNCFWIFVTDDLWCVVLLLGLSLIYVLWLIVAVSLDCPFTFSTIYSACSSQNPSFSSYFISGKLIGATIRGQLVVHKLFILQEYLSSPLVFSGFRVTQSLVFGVYALTTIACLYYFGHCILLRLTASDALWCIQNYLHNKK